MGSLEIKISILEKGMAHLSMPEIRLLQAARKEQPISTQGQFARFYPYARRLLEKVWIKASR